MSTKEATAQATISIDDFMTGFLAVLAGRGFKSVSIRSTFYEAIQKAYQEFDQVAAGAGCEVDFVVKNHPVHGDSPAVRRAITHAVQRDLISLDNPVYMDMRLKIDPSYADHYLDSLPGDRSWYEAMTDTFLRTYAEIAGV